jgi:hypothetical protein
MDAAQAHSPQPATSSAALTAAWTKRTLVPLLLNLNSFKRPVESVLIWAC